jgi:2-keto-4-pentenoate hydratase/2-oxohepta-3-ene-1,7-dioic acid hydratase in catechol pathway
MKIICIGRNYAEHARELNNDVPSDPVLFMKPESAIAQHGQPLAYPDFTKDMHYECELVVRIGVSGKFITEDDALSHVDAITLGIDFTARDVQSKLKEKGLPWELAKAFDGSAVVGNMQPLAFFKDLNNLRFELDKNGHTVQRGFTGDMLFPVARIIAHSSQYFSLQAGDLIFTGTPAGVGPVAPGDKLTGTLEGHKVLEMSIA